MLDCAVSVALLGPGRRILLNAIRWVPIAYRIQWKAFVTMQPCRLQSVCPPSASSRSGLRSVTMLLFHMHSLCLIHMLSTGFIVDIFTASREGFSWHGNTLLHLFFWLSFISRLSCEGWNCLLFLYFQLGTLNMQHKCWIHTLWSLAQQRW